MSEAFLQTTPILRIFSYEKAIEFYVDFLGFAIDWENRFEPDAPVYMQVTRGGLSFHLSEHFGDGTPGSIVFVRMTGLADFQRELIGKNYRSLRPGLEEAHWGGFYMETIDPFGNRVRFAEYFAADAAETTP